MKKYRTQPLVQEDMALLDTGKQSNSPLRTAFDKINEYIESLKSEISYISKSNTTLLETQQKLLEDNQDAKEKVTYLEAKNRLLETQLSRLYYILFKREVPDVNTDDFDELQQAELLIAKKKPESAPIEPKLIKKQIIVPPKKKQTATKSPSLDLYEKLNKLNKSVEPKKQEKRKSVRIDSNTLNEIKNVHLDDYEFPITYSSHLDAVRFFEKIKDGLFVTSGDDGRVVIHYKDKAVSAAAMPHTVSSMTFISEEGSLLLFGIGGYVSVVRFNEASVSNTDKKPMFNSVDKNTIKATVEDLEIDITTLKMPNLLSEGNVFSLTITETYIYMFSSSFKYCKLDKNKVVSLIREEAIDFGYLDLEWIPLKAQKEEDSLIADIAFVENELFIVLLSTKEVFLLDLSKSTEAKKLHIDYNDRHVNGTAISVTSEHLVIADSDYSIHFIEKENLCTLGADYKVSPSYTFDNASEYEIEAITTLDIKNEDIKTVLAFSTNTGIVRIITLSNKEQEKMVAFENELSEHETHSKIFKEIITGMKLTCAKENIELWLLGADSNLKMYAF
eukprot:GAHX01000970.1.p1 GENE.GAHX01000970.1~~GAHX01000970.1.p1  ORF type:complete len:568 (-),score=117.94 GAHX01000970.1:39-1718(-)